MGFALGRAPLSDGTGTQPEDLQRIIGASYMNSGIVPGPMTGVVTGTPAMSYEVDAGAAIIYANSAARLAYFVPFEATTVVTDPAPSTGTRTDTIYVDSGGAVRVKMGGSAPSGTVSLGQFIVPAGATSTQAVPNVLNRVYAIHAGGSLGRLAWYKHPSGGVGAATEKTLYSELLYFPTDRIVHVDVTTTIKSTSAQGVANFTAEFVGGSSRTLMAAHTSQWSTFGATWSFVVSAGERQFNFKSKPYSGGGWDYSFSSDVVTEVTVRDGGVSV